MSTKKAAAQRQQDQPQITSRGDVSIIGANPENVNWLRKFRDAADASVSDIVDEVQKKYPRYDRYLNSKVEHGEEYGIDLLPDAKKALESAFPAGRAKARKTERRTKPIRIYARVTKGVYERLQLLTEREGITVQYLIENMVLRYIKEREQSHAE